MSSNVVPPLVQAYVNQLEADKEEWLAAGVEAPPMAVVMEWFISELNMRGMLLNQLQNDVGALRNIIVNVTIGLTKIQYAESLDEVKTWAQGILDHLPKNGLNGAQEG
jgi:hypothetical protein